MFRWCWIIAMLVGCDSPTQVIVSWDMEADVAAMAETIRIELPRIGIDASAWIETRDIGTNPGEIKPSDFIPINPADSASDEFWFDARLSVEPPDFANPLLAIRFPASFAWGSRREIHFTFQASCVNVQCEDDEQTCIDGRCRVPFVNAAGKVVAASDSGDAGVDVDAGGDAETPPGGDAGICIGPALDAIVSDPRDLSPVTWLHPFPLLSDVRAACAVSDSEAYVMTAREVLRFVGGEWSGDLVPAVIGEERDEFIDIACSQTHVFVVGMHRVYERGAEEWTVRTPSQVITPIAISGDSPTVLASSGVVYQGESLGSSLSSNAAAVVGSPRDVLATDPADVFVCGMTGVARAIGGGSFDDLDAPGSGYISLGRTATHVLALTAAGELHAWSFAEETWTASLIEDTGVLAFAASPEAIWTQGPSGISVFAASGGTETATHPWSITDPAAMAARQSVGPTTAFLGADDGMVARLDTDLLIDFDSVAGTDLVEIATVDGESFVAVGGPTLIMGDEERIELRAPDNIEGMTCAWDLTAVSAGGGFTVAIGANGMLLESAGTENLARVDFQDFDIPIADFDLTAVDVLDSDDAVVAGYSIESDSSLFVRRTTLGWTETLDGPNTTSRVASVALIADTIYALTEDGTVWVSGALWTEQVGDLTGAVRLVGDGEQIYVVLDDRIRGLSFDTNLGPPDEANGLIDATVEAGDLEWAATETTLWYFDGEWSLVWSDPEWSISGIASASDSSLVYVTGSDGMVVAVDRP